MTRPTMADAGPLFESALQELGIPIPSQDDAAWTLLRYHIGRIAGGEVAPRQGLRAILEDVYYPAELHAQRERYGADVMMSVASTQAFILTMILKHAQAKCFSTGCMARTL